jgi:hypothetical protein
MGIREFDRLSGSVFDVVRIRNLVRVGDSNRRGGYGALVGHDGQSKAGGRSRSYFAVSAAGQMSLGLSHESEEKLHDQKVKTAQGPDGRGVAFLLMLMYRTGLVLRILQVCASKPGAWNKNARPA